MGWQFRKRIKVVPGVRMNLSRGGISTSVGTRGASLTMGKNGTYLNTGIPGTGIYRRDKLSGFSNGKTVTHKPNLKDDKKNHNGCGVISIIGIIILILILANSEWEFLLLKFGIGVIAVVMIDLVINMITESFSKKPSQETHHQLITELNTVKTAVSPEKEWLKYQIIESYISCLSLDREAAHIMATVEMLEKKIAKRNNLKYQNALQVQEASLAEIEKRLQSARFDADKLINEEQHSTYRNLCECFSELAASEKVWNICRKIPATESKSTATTLIDRNEITLNSGTFAFIKSENDVPVLIGNHDLVYYLFPSFIITVTGPASFDVSYLQDFIFTDQANSFLEESQPPADCEVLDYTYKFTNKDGTRDRRYSENPLLSLVQYHEIKFSTLSLTYQCSNSFAAKQFCAALEKHIRYLRNDVDESIADKDSTVVNSLLINTEPTFKHEYFSLLINISPAIVNIVSQLRADTAIHKCYDVLGIKEDVYDAVKYWVIYDLTKIALLLSDDALASDSLAGFGIALILNSALQSDSNSDWSERDFRIIKSAYQTGLYNNVITSLEQISAREHPFNCFPKLPNDQTPQQYLEHYLALPAFLHSIGSSVFDEYATVLFRFANIIAKADEIITVREKEILLTIYALTHKPSLKYVVQEKITKDILIQQSHEQESLKSCLDELQDLKGLDEVKHQITSFVNFISVQKQREKTGLKSAALSYHVVFTGNPGTGKTTVARILAKIYKHMGILSSGHLVEVDRSGLVAEYSGQTAVKVNKTVDSAINGILFIDEAYSLVGETNDDFGKEAVATLIKRIEDDRDRLVVILAGYTEEMNGFLETNPGIKSRFARNIHFPDYGPQDLINIFAGMCEKSEYKISASARTQLEELFKQAYEQRDKSFGNARFARNVFEATIERQANRIAAETALTKDILTLITEDDIANLS